jgi:8-hydroxy-5-deazaflavin:NADPH oxidoreductase
VRIGVIGAGGVGGALGSAWARRGHEICFGVPNPESDKTRALVAGIGGRARAGSSADAATFAEVVVLAVPWTAAETAVRDAGGLAGKIVIDCTNPLGMTPSGLGLVIGHTSSGGESIQRWAPRARVVKSLNTTGYGNMAEPLYAGQRSVMFVAGDDPAAKQTVGELVAELGFEVVDAGPLAASRLLEAHAMLWIDLALNRGLGRDFAFALLRR